MDNDPRFELNGRRFLVVLGVKGGFAHVQSFRTAITKDRRVERVYGRKSRIKLERFKPTTNGYILVSGDIRAWA